MSEFRAYPAPDLTLSGPPIETAPLADNGQPRCRDLGEHYARLLYFGWCGCGYDGCPRSAAEYLKAQGQ